MSSAIGEYYSQLRKLTVTDGTWDAKNEWIGSVVNSHTNLTEIKLAMDLLWRNDIDPEKVVMGLGFYGRSKESIYLFEEMGSADGLPIGFTLSDSSCTITGCPFLTGGTFN